MKRTSSRAVLLLTALVLLLTSCGAEPLPPEETVRVVVEDREEFTVTEAILDLAKGADVVIPCAFQPGYAFLSCNYADYSVVEREDGVTLLTLRDVRYPLRLKIEAVPSETSIRYFANGGEFLDGEGEYRILPVNTATHKRVNTSIGTNLVKRSGHTQTGWNTKPDGSGEHIGLGSRVTVAENSRVDLYAEWSPWTSPEEFLYVENSGGVTITGFTGTMPGEELSIPAYLDGKPVNIIASGAVKGNLPPRLVLPHTVNTAEDGAFSGGRVEEIFFYDALVSAKDSSFPNSIPTVHINAILPPKYQGTNTNVQFAENLDSLMLSKGQKKLIFFAGCSMSFGLVSSMVAEAFPDYKVLNMGVIGSTVAAFQLECISRFVEPGDVLVHAPEEQSRYQLMDLMEGEPRTFLMVEGNYDLLSYCDVSGIENFFGAYCSYNTARARMPDCTYDDRLYAYNEYGDYILERPARDEDVSWNTNDTYDPDFVNEVSLKRLTGCYDLFREKGATVLLSFAPHNYQSLSGSCIAQKRWNTYEARLRDGLEARGYTVISRVEDYIFSGRYFHDTDYHLNEPGAVLRTEQLIRDLKKYFSRG